MYVIVRNEDVAYVAKSDYSSSYTKYLQHAQQFCTREEAEKQKCENERVIPFDKA